MSVLSTPEAKRKAEFCLKTPIHNLFREKKTKRLRKAEISNILGLKVKGKHVRSILAGLELDYVIKNGSEIQIDGTHKVNSQDSYQLTQERLHDLCQAIYYCLPNTISGICQKLQMSRSKENLLIWTVLDKMVSEGSINRVKEKRIVYFPVDSSKITSLPATSSRIPYGPTMIRQILNELGIDYIMEYKFAACVNIRQLPFDFYVPSLNMLIEYDGEQHFKSVEAWGGEKAFALRKKHDNIKNEYASANGIHLVRFDYTCRYDTIRTELIDLKNNPRSRYIGPNY